MATRFAGGAQGLLSTIDFVTNQPDYDAISSADNDGRSLVRNAEVLGQAKVATGGLNAFLNISNQEAANAQAAAEQNARSGQMLGNAAVSASGNLIKGWMNRPPKTPTPAPPGAPNGTQLYGGQLINTGMAIG